MTRRKVDDKEKLTEKIGLRVSEEFYQKLERWRASSNCRTVGELARRILYKEEINWYHKDASMDDTIRELAQIRKELNAIGNNLNQIARAANGQLDAGSIATQVEKINSCIDQVRPLLAQLLETIGALSQKWLQK